MFALIMLCVWVGLFIGIGILMIVFSDRLNIWACRFAPSYYRFLDKLALKLLHVETTYLQSYFSRSVFFRIPFGVKGIKISGIMMILVALMFFILVIWPRG